MKLSKLFENQYEGKDIFGLGGTAGVWFLTDIPPTITKTLFRELLEISYNNLTSHTFETMWSHSVTHYTKREFPAYVYFITWCEFVARHPTIAELNDEIFEEGGDFSNDFED